MSSPRQTAKAAGRKWYLPDAPCPKCNARAPRYVANGRCRGCATGRKPTNDMMVMTQLPDAVFSRQEAIVMGMKVYRTGKQCPHGHAAYRYVSTCRCVKCVRS